MRKLNVLPIVSPVIIVTALVTVLSLSPAALSAENQLNDSSNVESLCPSKVVDFWISYAKSHNNLSSIPAFLFTNNCINEKVSTDFFSAMQKRFDEPDQKRWRNDLEEALHGDVASL